MADDGEQGRPSPWTQTVEEQEETVEFELDSVSSLERSFLLLLFWTNADIALLSGRTHSE
jgi:hypothetical protein